MFDRNTFLLISLTEFLQILHLADIYGLLFDVNLPIGLNHLYVFCKIDRISFIYKYIILIHF